MRAELMRRCIALLIHSVAMDRTRAGPCCACGSDSRPVCVWVPMLGFMWATTGCVQVRPSAIRFRSRGPLSLFGYYLGSIAEGEALL